MRMQSVVAALGLLLATSLPSLAAPLGEVRVGLIEGDVQTRSADTDGWVPAAVNTALAEGDELWVPKGGKVELQLSDGTYVRLDYESALQILQASSDSYHFFLSQGRAYVRFRAMPNSVLQLDAPDATVRAFEPCSFDVELSGDYTDVSSYRGSVEVQSRSGQSPLTAGSVLTVDPDGRMETAALGPRDDWEVWNRQRNGELLREGPSDRYLPEPLRCYASDFDRGGRWVTTPEYGSVWIPADAANADWAPYRSGRWFWRGGDYVWVGYEPWGWAPYHYGRWAFVPPFGWCWVPPPPDGIFWGPGFVGWVRTPEYVGWVPLAPREIYYGRGYYGRYSVDITHTSPDRIRFRDDYRNARTRNGFIVVHRETFLTGAPPPVPFRPDEIRRKIYRRENMVFGRPPVDPVRATRMPIVKAIPPPFLPPPAVEKLRIDTVRRARPFERRRDESRPPPVFVPIPLPEKPAPVPRRRLEHVPARPAERGEERRGLPPGQVVPERRPEPGPGRRPDGDERLRGPDRQREQGPRPVEPRRPQVEPAKPEKPEEKRSGPQPQVVPPPERRPEPGPGRRPEGDDRMRGPERSRDQGPRSIEPKRAPAEPARPDRQEERRPGPQPQVVPPPERRPEPGPGRRPEDDERTRGPERPRDQGLRTSEPRRSPEAAKPERQEERRPAPRPQVAPPPERRPEPGNPGGAEDRMPFGRGGRPSPRDDGANRGAGAASAVDRGTPDKPRAPEGDAPRRERLEGPGGRRDRTPPAEAEGVSRGSDRPAGGGKGAEEGKKRPPKPKDKDAEEGGPRGEGERPRPGLDRANRP